MKSIYDFIFLTKCPLFYGIAQHSPDKANSLVKMNFVVSLAKHYCFNLNSYEFPIEQKNSVELAIRISKYSVFTASKFELQSKTYETNVEAINKCFNDF